jgi:hypothetical protein
MIYMTRRKTPDLSSIAHELHTKTRSQNSEVTDSEPTAMQIYIGGVAYRPD